MPPVIKKKMLVIEAKYVKEADGIILIGECEEGKIRHQIDSACFSFGGRDVETEMTELAKLMVGKSINVEFNPNIQEE